LPLNGDEKRSELDRETFKRLQEADWTTLQSQLLACATWQAGGYRWHRGDDLELAEGKTVEDVVQEVIMKTLSGARQWNPARGPLLPWLQAQSRSIIDALAKSASHRHEVSTLDLEGLASAHSPDPLEAVLEKEANAQSMRRVAALFQAVDKEPELQTVLQVILDSCEPRPRYIAAELGVPVDEVNNRMKRLRRRAAKLAQHDVHQSR